jgi:hypothetical protein
MAAKNALCLMGFYFGCYGYQCAETRPDPGAIVRAGGGFKRLLLYHGPGHKCAVEIGDRLFFVHCVKG